MDPDLKIATHNSIPNQEYALYGSVLESEMETLLHRLRGLCGTMPGNGEPFEDHCVIYSFKHISPPICVRAVRPILLPSVPWRFLYYGDPGTLEAGRSLTQRQIIDACCSVRLPKFLEDGLGFTVDYEYFFKGTAFAKGRVKILVGRVMKPARDATGGVEKGEAITKSFLVEVSAVAFGGAANEPSANEVVQFADLLLPIVKLERIDLKRFASQI
ncbi:mediator of RNA polymerase II transcription subunit 18-like [Paramacrobiotus metropolitanus]|uniref:mediator of RNA polymerase II transcription subunit 18-like n=1 Tax=Paramacrobiotus metropolitanus TaxID=2943436 RepID=UPI002446025A|nr:mediator of RNA polymerase II transcription subunit 18-like [Paramacrobiotus metropolitanus]